MTTRNPPSSLQGFKISDQVKQQIKQPTERTSKSTTTSKSPASSGGSAGFPKIEALVESDQPDLSGFTNRMNTLVEMSKSATTNKDKLAAKKAAQAYQHVHALLSHLFETKAKMRKG